MFKRGAENASVDLLAGKCTESIRDSHEQKNNVFLSLLSEICGWSGGHGDVLCLYGALTKFLCAGHNGEA
jgi:hypothetical protein